MSTLRFRAWDASEKTMVSHAKLVYDPDDWFVELIQGEGSEGDVLMQSTGLKDKNGKEIFEGDILQGNAFGIVIFNRGKFTGCYTCSHNTKGWDYSDDWEDDIDRMNVEVIGNIYQHADLLTSNSL